jgi:aspartate/methionine/tyrosine aminotransferase
MPTGNPSLREVPLSVFDSIIAELGRAGRRHVIPLHQGKTAYTSPVGLREWGAGEFDFPPYIDGPPGGSPMLLQAVQDKLQRQLDQEIDPARIQITSGISHALSIIFHTILCPGDEVLVLSPHWLFTGGMVRAAHGVPVEIPFFSVSGPSDLDAATARVAARITSRTRAIYFNTPNNPTGLSVPAPEIAELARLAVAHDLWLVSDNAYEYYDFTRDGFTDPASLAWARDHTFSAYSFSKSFGLTGYRVGYLLSPPAMAETVRKFALYSIYSVPVASQFAALAALRGGSELIKGHRDFVRRALELTVSRLVIPCTRPEGGFYTFLDLSGWPGGAGDFIGRCIRAGVSLAPGHAFGDSYPGHARLCYAVVGHDDLAEGIGIINSVYESVLSPHPIPVA